MTPSPQSILMGTFGYDEFLPRQKDVIDNILNHRDTLAIMPTGGGKSLCYQIPALILPGITVVVSPLIALMKDQIDQLNQLGVQAVTLNSSLNARDYIQNTEKIRKGLIRLVYMAPETLLSDRVSNLLTTIQVDLLVIDEAHCISEWGHDFRPEYREIIKTRRQFPKTACLALTATATHKVRADIKRSLGFEDHNEFISSFDRKNLLIEVVPKMDAPKQALEMIHQFSGRSGIIYCFSRKQVNELSTELANRHISALPYHAGLTDGERKRNQEAFIRDDANVIVATIAFGMGINKPDVRFVLHYDLPKSLEGYYQEIGRAGRDGQTSVCRLLFSYGDKRKIEYFIREKTGTEKAAAEQQLDALIKYKDTPGCRRKPLLAYFGETYQKSSCGMCDRCLADREKVEDITIPAQKFLSCVKRSGEVFGAAHIIDILTGESTEKVKLHNHQNLSTFGIGREWPKSRWLQLADQLVDQQLIEKTGQFNSLVLTESATQALRDRKTITAVKPLLQPFLYQDIHKTSQSTSSPGEKTTIQSHRQPEADTNLYESLRQLRKNIADQQGIPPYAIFSDRTLVEMAAYHPQSLPALKLIHGVGSVKSERFGKEFLNAIKIYCEDNGLKEIIKPEADTVRKNVGKPGKNPRFVEVAKEFIAGASIAELSKTHMILPQSVIGYLIKYVKAGREIPNPKRILSYSKIERAVQEKVLTGFEDLGGEYLNPVYKFMNETVDFNELRILQLYYLCSKKNK